MTNINSMAERIHATAVAHGFWPPEGRNMGEMIALAHSELSEALEEHRSGQPNVYAICGECGVLRTTYDWPHGPHGWVCHGLPLKPEGLATELADCIIRCLDTMQSLGVDVEQVIRLKMEYNDQREHMHGRNY